MKKTFLILTAAATVSAHAIDLNQPVSIHIDERELNKTYVLGWGSKLMDFAVKDFADHLNRVCPGSWEINPKVPKKQKIILGKAAVRAYHLEDSAKALNYGAYRIKTQGDNLLIYGNDAQSTINGMYAFLENHLGYHWFGPSEEFRVFPPQGRKMKFDRIDESVKPDFLTRELKGAGFPGRPGFIWGIRNRLFRIDGAWDLSVNHNIDFLLPVKKYGKTHPEYYSMDKKGKRLTPARGAQMCYSNPDVLNIVQKKAEQFFNQGADKVAFSLCASDSHISCRCPECIKTQPPRKEDIYCFSDMHMAFMEKVAARLKNKYPGRRLGTYAYAACTLPPLKKLSHGDFYILAVTPDFSQYADPEYREKELNIYRAWLKQMPGAKVHWHAYTSLCQVAPCYYPSLFASTTKRLFNEFNADSMLGEGTGFWPVTGPQIWMMGKLLWNVKADPEKLLNEYFTTLYGPAASTVRALYDRLEKSYLAGSKTGGKWFRHHGTLTAFNYYTAEDALFCRESWKKARSIVAGDPAILRRIDYMSTRMEPVLQMLEGWDLSKRLAGNKPVPAAYGSRDAALSYCVRAVCNLESQWQKIIRMDMTMGSYAYDKRRPKFDYYATVRNQWHGVCSENLAKVLAEHPNPDREKLFSQDPVRAAILGLEQKKYFLLPELLLNPGFEIGKGAVPAGADWIPTGVHDWAFDSGSPENLKHGRVLDNAAAEGKYSGIIQGKGNGSFLTSAKLNFENGSRFFILEAQSWKKDPDVRVYLRIMWRDGKDKLMAHASFRSANSEETGKWVRQRIIVEAPKEAASAVILLCGENLKESEVRFDAVSFRQIQLTPFKNPTVKGTPMPTAEKFQAAKPDDLMGIPRRSLTCTASGKYTFNRAGTILSSTLVKVKPDTSWQLSGRIVSTGAKPARSTIGIHFLDKDFRPIFRYNINRQKGTCTKLIAACNPSDKILKVESSANWKADPYAKVAFNCKPDNSDLPNFQISQRAGIAEVKPSEIVLNHETGYSFPAGSWIAQHMPGATYCYLSKVNMEIPSEGVNFSYVFSESKLWPAAAYIRVIVLTNGPIELSELELKPR